MEKLKTVLLGVVLLLGAAVVYGYVDDGGTDTDTFPPSSSSSSGAESRAAAPDAGAPDDPVKTDGGGKEPAFPSGDGDDQSGGETGSDGKRAGDESPEKSAKRSGSGGGQVASEGAPPSRAEFISSADAICAKTAQRFTDRFERVQSSFQGGKSDPAAQLAAVRRLIVQTIRQTAREFGALQAPVGDKQKVAAMVAAIDKGARIVRRNEQLVVDGTKSPLAEFATLSKRYGLARCSQF